MLKELTVKQNNKQIIDVKFDCVLLECLKEKRTLTINTLKSLKDWIVNGDITFKPTTTEVCLKVNIQNKEFTYQIKFQKQEKGKCKIAEEYLYYDKDIIYSFVAANFKKNNYDSLESLKEVSCFHLLKNGVNKEKRFIADDVSFLAFNGSGQNDHYHEGINLFKEFISNSLFLPSQILFPFESKKGEKSCHLFSEKNNTVLFFHTALGVKFFNTFSKYLKIFGVNCFNDFEFEQTYSEHVYLEFFNKDKEILNVNDLSTTEKYGVLLSFIFAGIELGRIEKGCTIMIDDFHHYGNNFYSTFNNKDHCLGLLNEKDIQLIITQ